MLRKMNRNSRVVILAEVPGALSSVVLMFFAPLYMAAHGLDGAQIGIINMAVLVSGFFAQLVASAIVDRLGRRATMLWFTFVCWSVPILIWILFPTFWGFLVGYVIYGAARITGIAWYCMLTEDASQPEKVSVFGILFLNNSIVGVMTFVVGLFVKDSAAPAAMKVIYIVTFAAMTLINTVRHFLVRETALGQRILAERRRLNLAGQIKSQLAIMAAVFRQRELRSVSGLYFILNILTSVAFVQSLYGKQAAGLSFTLVSSIPAITAVLNILIYRYVMKRLSEHAHWTVLFVSALGYAALCLLLGPATALWPVASLVLFGVMGGMIYLMQVAVNSTFTAIVGDELSSKLSAVQVMVLLGTAPFAWLAGWLFNRWQISPFLMMGLVCLLAAWMAFDHMLWNRRHRPTNASQEG